MIMNTIAIVIYCSATSCDANNKANKDEPNSMKQH